MFWADRIVGEIERRFAGEIGSGTPIMIRDEWTASGRGHVGSMRGVAIHGIVHEILDGKKIPNAFRYEINDFDPMDGFPAGLNEEFRQYLGRQLFDIPSPEPDKAKNFAEYFTNEFKSAIAHAGFEPKFYWASELYLSGQMDNLIFMKLSGRQMLSAPSIKRSPAQ